MQVKAALILWYLALFLPGAAFAANTNSKDSANLAAGDISIFTSPTPAATCYGNGTGMELGVKFRSDKDGLIRGIRFYKSQYDTTAHTGTLWSGAGAQLATGAFTNESASGWQEMTFASPVSIKANTTYIASYHTNGWYCSNTSGFQSSVDNAPLHALKDGLDGPNGVYALSPNGGVTPTLSFLGSNYWADVLFTPSGQASPGSVSAVAGTPQSANVGTSFGAALQAKVLDTSSNPMAGVTVVFAAPGSGASATFNGSASASAVTNATGIATSPVPVANATAGGYSATATVSGLPAAQFALTNTSAPAPVQTAGSVAANAGTPQSATVSTAFGAALQAKVLDTLSNPMSGVTVVFAAPASGASATFGGLTSATVITNASGIATSPIPTANATTGSYSVTATVSGVANPASFSLTNTAAAGVAVTVSPKTVTLGPSGTQTFTAQVTGTGNTAVTWSLSPNTGSLAGNVYTAPSTISSTQTVILTATSQANGSIKDTATITLTAAPMTIWPANYTPATTCFGNAAGLEFGVKFRSDVDGQIRGIRFYKSGNDSSSHTGTLWSSDGTALATGAFTNESAGGWQQMTFASPVDISANKTYVASYHTAGWYCSTIMAFEQAGVDNPPLHVLKDREDGPNGVYANSPDGGVLPTQSFLSTNYWVDVMFSLKPPSAKTVTALSGTPQSTAVNTSFGAALQAKVLDAQSNPVQGVTVTFAAPGSGASATFGGNATVTAVTDASGVATSPVKPAANATAGTYSVTATVGNLTPAQFSLTNTSLTPVATSVTAVAGTPQSTTVSTSFGAALQAKVSDAGSNPISGVTVTFTAPSSGASATLSGSVSATAVTNASGIATSPIPAANATAGSYVISATTGNLTPAQFSLTNTSVGTASLSAVAGTPQNATTGSSFGAALQAKVTNAAGNPVAGVSVTFAAPGSGASATFNGSASATVTTNGSGIATSPVPAANATAGTYSVTASASGYGTASFSLTNNGAGGTTYYVSPSGSDDNDGKSIDKPFKTFWAAQKVLTAGDTLLVRGGVHTDAIFVPSANGEPGRPITVKAYPGEKPVISGNSVWGAFVINIYNYWVFEGLTYANLLDGNYVFWMHDANHITLRNISISKHKGDMIIFQSCDDVVVENSYFDTTGAPGDTGAGEHIWLAGSRRALIQNNVLIRAGHASISIIDDNRNGRSSQNNVVRNNIIEQHWGGGIYVGNNSRANLIEGNRISFAGEQDPYTKLGMGISCPENIVRNNTIFRTGSDLQPLDNGMGMYAWDDGAKRHNAVDNRIYNNVVSKSAGRGLYFFLRGDSVATRNKFLNNAFYADKQQLCDPWGCATGVELAVNDGQANTPWQAFPNENYFFNNLMLGQLNGTENAGAPMFAFQDWTKSLSQLQSGYPNYFKSNIEVTPDFVNSDAGNFGLKSTSKLINAGMDLTRTTEAGSNTTIVTVEDARFFTDGYAGVVTGDSIRVGANTPVTVTAIDFTTNRITVDRAITFSSGDAVNLARTSGKPDIGAFEYGPAVQVVSGNPQSGVSGSAFAAQLVVTVTDGTKPVAGVPVTFMAPAEGISASFGGAPFAIVMTDSTGTAKSPAPVAGIYSGTYFVTATTPGAAPATFTLTNTGGQILKPAAVIGKTLFINSTGGNPITDGTSIELGVKFQSDMDGVIEGIRFYKTATDTSVHTASLWKKDGTLIARGVFTGETAQGWQQMTFPTPVSISANTTYVASYHTSSGFTYQWNYFTDHPLKSGPLKALQSGTDGPNGVYAYSSSLVFPTLGFQDTNYYVDVVFTSSEGELPTPANMVSLSGTPQTAITGAAFAQGLTVRVTDALAKPVRGVTVTFTAPASGASALFGNSNTTTAVTDVNGTAVSATPVANGTTGAYSVIASAQGVPNVTFSLTNNSLVVPLGDANMYGGPPTGEYFNDSSSIELGVKFRSDTAGLVKGIRFYKNEADTSTHKGSLWTLDGVQLATGTFTNESPSGWQELKFATPVAISANKTYVASYHTSSGFYYTWYAFSNASKDSPPLHALKSGIDGGNGVYVKSADTAFPTDTYVNSDYFVDVVFAATGSGPSPKSITVYDGSGQTATVGTTFAKKLKAKVADASGGAVAGATVTFTAPSSGASAAFTGSASAVVTSDSSGIATAPDAVANNVSGTYSVSATTSGLTPANFTLTNGTAGGGGGGNPPVTKTLYTTAPSAAFSFGLSSELGVKFRSDVAGTITGVRFYKDALDTGSHTGALWSADGTLLASGTFVNETASGWQQLTFSQPVEISANTTYVASYHTSGAYYYSAYYFLTQGVDSPPLHALKEGVDGPNGVIAVSPAMRFPSSAVSSTNYWVDVMFVGK